MSRTTTRIVAVLLVISLVLLLARIARSESTAEAIPARVPAALPATLAQDTAVFAGGCFWGIEGVFDHMKGVVSSMSGYAGGTFKSPSYEDVTTGRTGHAEAVRVVFDPAQVSYATLLQVFFSVAHDPTQLNRQGPDVGTQYRSAVFYKGDAQKSAVQAHIAQLTKGKAFPKAIVTQVVPFTEFYVAETYHQDYMAKNPDQPYIVINDAPKVADLKRRFPALYRERQ